MDKRIRTLGFLALVLLWAGFAAFAWFSPAKDASLTERRPLNQFPAVSADSVLSGRFATAFEKYANDQFPARDLLRSVKALTHRYALLQKDTNGLYLTDGYLVKQDYPLNTEAVDRATARLQWVYEHYLKDTGSRVYCSVIPDKAYYMAQESGQLALDYDALFHRVAGQLPFAEYVDLTGCLGIESYYRTDTHWRQEALASVAGQLLSAMDMPYRDADRTVTEATDTFYGVYHGQAALPLPEESLYLVRSPELDACQVSIHNMQAFVPVAYQGLYDLDKLDSKEPYDVFLSGTQSLLRIENPNAATDRELIIFRDSFGSSLAPLLVSDYKTVTLVDIRYINSQLLGRYLEFKGQDVLFLYSSLILNGGGTLQ